eukprot:CAMPEP_0113284228 /NCGR_PEP_ID=MMETSP0008_2-20120614/29897_1 /TAXON_ID=97485 /ORGANISM="Prymnesium parvum" /LENGTH=101 /DNA_ID=CAMNT_0000135047 /DNA_START=184 /DNA_END=487 /DNA_ORIENTATION=+ /assembly_acc=CAM_ASM_000153
MSVIAAAGCSPPLIPTSTPAALTSSAFQVQWGSPASLLFPSRPLPVAISNAGTSSAWFDETRVDDEAVAALSSWVAVPYPIDCAICSAVTPRHSAAVWTRG